MILLHCEKLNLKQGDAFKKGDIIAYVGNTGRSTAPHLHYQLQHGFGRGQKIIDPVKHHNAAHVKMSGENISNFMTLKTKYESLLEKL